MRSIRGSTLIESLVALAVFAIGSASTATWMMHSMATDARASRLTAAATIAVSLEARMRANRDGILAGAYAQRDGDAASSRPRRCDVRCDSTERAADDLWLFRDELARRVGPAAVPVVACDASVCDIRIDWAGRPLLAWPFRP